MPPDRFEDGQGAVHDVLVGAMVGEEAPAVAARLGGDAHVLERGGIGQDIGDLVGAGDAAPGDAVGREARDVLAREDDAAARGAQHAGHTVEERALAGPVGSDDGPDLTGLHGEAHVVERGETAEAYREALGAEDRGGAAAPAGNGRGGHGATRGH